MFSQKEFPIRTFSTNEALVAERRDYIIQSSTKLLTRKGYENTNMREIAKACHTSTGTLYHYFGSKEDILYYLIDKATTEQLEYLKSCAHDLEKVQPGSAVEQFIEKYFKWHGDHQNMTLFVYQETKNLPRIAQQDIISTEDQIHSILESLLKKGMESGEFHIDAPSLLAHNIMALAHAWAVRQWFLRKRWTLQTYTSHQFDLILRQIKEK